MRVGVILTKDWLLKDFAEPIQILSRMSHLFPNFDMDHLYRYFKSHGMYSPNDKAKKSLQALIDMDVWTKVEEIYQTYRTLWNGPNVPIYIFPLQASSFFSRSIERKSGLAYPHVLFLFLDGQLTKYELEAIFIHEYHHVCRLNRLNKREYTLLDGVVMEGLAEFAVRKYVGVKYVANWTNLYKKNEFIPYWKRYLEEELNIKRDNPLHDKIMFGHGNYPSMLGYWSGYQLVTSIPDLSMKESFVISSEEILNRQTIL